MLKKINAFLDKYKINLEKKKICVCFSGGSDSVALLSAFYEIKEKTEFNLLAVHVNHNIRGDEAKRDENFCIDFCKEKKIPLFVLSVNAPLESEKNGEGLEETARKLRYGEFEALREREKIDFFLTAHHKNDTAETIVFNFLRGCGVSGLTGIPPVRDFYLRPLLECSKEEILSYLKEKNECFVEDGTNVDQTYTRNYIRHSLFEAFRKVNPSFLSAIKRLSESALQDEDYFEKQLDKITRETNLSLLHPAVSSRYICKKYAKLSGGEGLSFVHVKQILSCLDSKEEKSIDVPFGIKAVVQNGKVFFLKKELSSNKSSILSASNDISDNLKKESEADTEIFFQNNPYDNSDNNGKIYLQMGKNVFSQSVSVCIEEKFVKLPKFALSPLKIVLDGEKIKGKLFARKREQGDKIFCRGIRRSVNKELMNLKVPKYARDSVPVICDEEGIVFVPFVGASDRAFLKNETSFPLLVSVDMGDIFSY